MIINYNKVVDKLGAEMDTKVLQSKLIASNIANVDTPGYIAKDLKFDHVLKQNVDELNLTMKVTNPRHMTNGVPGILNNEIVEDPNPGRPDGNNVNIDDELLKLSENNIQYNVAVQLLAKHMGHIKDSIQQAGK
jgi:flagellar basal-body rod protein FlgB